MNAKVTVTSDFTEQFKALVSKFKNDRVLVGIPEDHSARQDDEEGVEGINNATLLAIANFGSPARNIPPWPIMAIGIRNATGAIGEQYEKAAQLSLRSGTSALDTHYNRAGQIAANEIKKTINSQEGVPSGKPEQSTLDARKHRKPTPFKGTKYWLVTGQMRNAITYVIGGRTK